MMGIRGLVVALLVGGAFPVAAGAQALYAGSVRGIAGGAPDEVAGSLYTVAAGTATATFAAPLRVGGQTPIGLTGIAVHPASGVFYGITSTRSKQYPQTLVTFDPDTGDASVVGPLGHAGSDIAFSRAGLLFAWIYGTQQLGQVNVETGAVTPIGEALEAGPPAGLAIDAQGVGYVTPRGAGGTLDRINIATGKRTPGPAITGAPYPAAINSMTFTPEGALLAVNSNAGSPANTALVSLDTATGAAVRIGALPDDTDGLAFTNVPPPDDTVAFGMSAQSLALAGLFTLALVLGLIGWIGGRKPRHAE